MTYDALFTRVSKFPTDLVKLDIKPSVKGHLAYLNIQYRSRRMII